MYLGSACKEILFAPDAEVSFLNVIARVSKAFFGSESNDCALLPEEDRQSLT